MTLQTGRRRRATATGALALGLLMGFGSATAYAEPGDSTDATVEAAEPTPTMTADQALAIIAEDYQTGAGGGQLSKLIDEVLRLRAQGFRPSNRNKVAIEKALDYRPNQKPLIEALQDTLAYQRKQQMQAAAIGATQQGPYTVGIG